MGVTLSRIVKRYYSILLFESGWVTKIKNDRFFFALRHVIQTEEASINPFYFIPIIQTQ